MNVKHMGLWALGAMALFGAGWWAIQSKSHGEEGAVIQGSPTKQQRDNSAQKSGEGSHDNLGMLRSRRGIPQELLVALQGSPPARAPALLNALEKIAMTEFTPEWAAVIDKILQAADTEECQYVFSLLEQREEAASVAYMLKQLDHENEDVRDRALMACESVAGQIFSSAEQARTWGKSWTPDPEKEQLFAKQPTLESATKVLRPGQRPNKSEPLLEKRATSDGVETSDQ